MRNTSSNKSAKENFYSKNSNNYGMYNQNNNFRSPPKIPNFKHNYSNNKPNNFETLFNKKELNSNISYKLNPINTNNTPHKLKKDTSNSPNLPYIKSNNGALGQNTINNNNNYNSNLNANHSRFSSSISNNSNYNNNNNTSFNNLNTNKTPFASDNISLKPINNSSNNTNNNYVYGVNNIHSNMNNNINNSNNINNNYNNYSINGGYNNIQRGNSASNRKSSARHNSNISNNAYNDSIAGISKTNANHSLTNNNNNVHNNYLNVNHNSNLDSNIARIRPLSRNQSNNNGILASNYANVNKISENNITTNYNINNNSVRSNNNSNTNLINNQNNIINNGNYKASNSLQIKFDITRKLVGFKNLGNTCFMNTSLQCIMHCDIFISRFLEYCDLKKPLRSTPISNSFLNLIESYSKASDKSAISPDELKSAIARKHRIYSGFSQQDSQEFIRKLLDEISQELNLITEKKPYKMLNANNEQENKTELNIEYDKIFRDRENSIVVDTFYGQSISIFSCLDCNYESYSYEKFLDIPLLLEETSNDQEIAKLLAKYFETENIKWESPCDNKACKRKSMHKKKLKLSTLPDILILSLQRYNNRLRRKNNCRVNFREVIDIKEYTDSACLSGIF